MNDMNIDKICEVVSKIEFVIEIEQIQDALEMINIPLETSPD